MTHEQTLVITGGQPLVGSISLSGAKNAATKMMIASLLTDEPVILTNCPRLGDVEITAEICEAVGSTVTFKGHSVTLHTPKITSTTVGELSRRNRLPVLALSPLLHRAGHAKVPVVIGDQIGPRPVNFHIAALKTMGAIMTIHDDAYEAHAKELVGTNLLLPYPSVMATENIIFAAVLARGRTTIKNAALEPEILDIIMLLQKMGAIIEFQADRTIIVDGVKKLHGATHDIMPDRLEAASFATAAIATDGDILIKGARQVDLITYLNTLRRMGAEYIVESNGIRFRRGDGKLKGIQVETDTHPGFATDWQQPLTVLLTQAHGRSVIHETVFEDRFAYTEVLREMGAEIEVMDVCIGQLPCRFQTQGQPHSAIIFGPTKLHGTNIEIPDIRAGMAQVIAALIAKGESRLTGVEHLIRGYDNLAGKLHDIGAQFTLEA